MEVFKLFGSILIDDKEAQKSLSKTDKNTKTLGERFRGGIKTVAKWGTAIVGAAVGAGAAMFGLANKATQTADAIAKGAEKVGMSTDFYQEMDFWASQNGLSHEQMEKTLGRFNQRLGMATNGNKKYVSALQQLGINLDDVRDGTLSTEDAFAQSIKTLSEMENEQDKVNLATEMFGVKLSRELMPALNDGSLSIDDARKKAQELGLVLDEDSLYAAEAFQDSWDMIKRSMSTATTQIGLDLMPAFQKMMDWLIEKLPAIRATFSSVFDAIGVAVSWVSDIIGKFRDGIAEMVSNNGERLSELQEIAQERLMFVWEIIQTVLENIRTFWQENGEQLVENAITVFTKIQEFVNFVMENVWVIIQTILDLVVPFIAEQLAKIKAFWDENGEQIMQAVNNAFNFIKAIIDFIMPIITGIIKGAWSIITAIFDTAIGIVMGLIKFFASMFTGDFEGMAEGAQKIIKSLWDGIKGIVSGAWNLLKGAFGGLWQSISKWFGGLRDDAIDWGKNMIKGFIDGIKGMAGAVGEAAGNVVKKAGEFIKFWSPAKKGEGRYIVHWGRNMIDGFLDGVEQEGDRAGLVMNDVVANMKPEGLQSEATVSQNNTDMSTVESLLVEVVDAIREGKNIVLNDKVLAKETADARTEYDGKMVRHTGRRLAT